MQSEKAVGISGGGTWTFNYNGADQLTSIVESFGYNPAVSFYYHPNGQLSHKYFGNNTRTYYGYNNRGWTTSISHRLFSGSEVEQQLLGYTYDSAGNPLTYSHNSMMTGQSWSTTYGYDYTHRLTSEVRTGSTGATFNNVYSLDGNGNRTNVSPNGVNYSYSVGNNDQLLAGEGYSFHYNNNNGNRTTIWSPALNGYMYPVYDYENRMTSVSFPGGSNSFWYNGTAGG